MGNSNAAEHESSRNFGAKFLSKKMKRIRGHSSRDDIDVADSIAADLHPVNLTEVYESRRKMRKNKNKSESKKKTKKNKNKSKSKSKSKKDVKEPSQRVKRIEDYFQWDSITEEQKEMYYEFISTAKSAWENNGYDDEEVRKVVLDRIALMRF